MVARRRSARRRAQRGASVLIVVLLLSLLMGIGMFAARAASLATAASGYERQQTQTHYFTNYAVALTANELSTNRAGAYVQLMTDPLSGSSTPCASNVDRDTGLLVLNATCYRFGMEDIRAALGGTDLLVDAKGGASPEPGSLGRASMAPSFLVEMTDLGPASPPVAGTDLSSSGAASVTYMAVTLNATGRIQPRSAATDPTENPRPGQTAGLERSRAHLVIGPLPKL